MSLNKEELQKQIDDLFDEAADERYAAANHIGKANDLEDEAQELERQLEALEDEDEDEPGEGERVEP